MSAGCFELANTGAHSLVHKVVERGTHAELMAAEGEYHNLVNTQMRRGKGRAASKFN